VSHQAPQQPVVEAEVQRAAVVVIERDLGIEQRAIEDADASVGVAHRFARRADEVAGDRERPGPADDAAAGDRRLLAGARRARDVRRMARVGEHTLPEPCAQAEQR